MRECQASTPPSALRAAQECPHLISHVTTRLLEQVRVDVGGEREARVTKRLLHIFQRRALGDQHRRCRVPQLVEGAPREACFLAQPLHSPAEHRPVEEPPGHVGEDETAVLDGEDFARVAGDKRQRK